MDQDDHVQKSISTFGCTLKESVTALTAKQIEIQASPVMQNDYELSISLARQWHNFVH